jgi:hypothetical protein
MKIGVLWLIAGMLGLALDLLSGFSVITMRVIARALFGQGLAQADLDRVSQVMAFALDYMLAGAMTYSLPGGCRSPARAATARRCASSTP